MMIKIEGQTKTFSKQKNQQCYNCLNCLSTIIYFSVNLKKKTSNQFHERDASEEHILLGEKTIQLYVFINKPLFVAV